MNREYILDRMQHSKCRELVCFDEAYNYYLLSLCSYSLLYRQKRFRNDGRRCYFLTEPLAKALNFDSLFELRFYLSTLQFWRHFVSVERLRVAFARYDDKWGDFTII